MLLSKHYYLSDIILEMEEILEDTEELGYSEETIAVFKETLKQSELAYMYLNRVYSLVNQREYENSFHLKLQMDLTEFSEQYS